MRKVTKALFLVIIIINAFIAPAQQALKGTKMPVGDYLSHELSGSSLQITAQNGILHILPFLPQTVRITFIPTGISFHDTSYSVVLEPSSLSPELTEQPDHLVFSTGELQLVISKYPVSISFVMGLDTVASEHVGSYALDGGQGASFALGPHEMLYGGGSRALPLNRRGYEFDNYNQPHYGYSNWEANLNISIPAILSSGNYMLLFDNAFPGHFDLGATDADVLDYYCESGPLSYFMIAGDDNDRLLDQYTQLTGRQPLPPQWGMGFIQSRFGYENEAHARYVVESMRAGGFPMDAIVLDLYWYGGVEDMCNMTWDYVRFPDPVEMMADFRNDGIRTILIGETYFTQNSVHYNFLSSLDYLCTNNSGNTYVLNGFWAGPAGLLDLTRPAAFNWMWTYYDARIGEGAAGWWSDLGEPEQHPDDMVHYKGTAREVHNVYSLMWAKGLYEKYAQHHPDERLFNLTRSGYAGMQRYSTFPWSGDVSKSWEGLQAQIPIMLGMGLSGVAYMGSDLGGFTGMLDEELYTRWMQFGCFSPVMRPHGAGATTEPVFISSVYRDILRTFVRLRYQLLPYTYSLARENSRTGRPLAMPMNYFDPDNVTLGNLSDQYFWGEELLVAPVMESGTDTRSVYLPEGVWIDFWTHETYEGEGKVNIYAPADRIPLLVKAGSFLPMATPMLSTDYYHSDTLLVWYYPDKSNPYSSFDVYQDDGETKDADQKGLFEIISLNGDAHDDNITISLNIAGGGYAGAPSSRELIFDIKRIKKQPETVLVDGINLQIVNTIQEFQTLPAASCWDEMAEVLKVHFRWDTDTSTLVITGAGLGLEGRSGSPIAFEVYPPAPNPFSEHTRLRYYVAESGEFVFIIRNPEGKLIYKQDVVIGNPGSYEFVWNGKDDTGRAVGNGIYILSLHGSSGQHAAQKLIRID